MDALDRISQNNLRIEKLEKKKNDIIKEKEKKNKVYDYSIECFESEIDTIKRENALLESMMIEEDENKIVKRYTEYMKKSHEEIIKK